MRSICILILFLSSLPNLFANEIRLEVDATEAPRRIFHSTLTVPAQEGPLTLYYPKWFPGTHAPTGQLQDMVGLRIKAAGRDLAWKRDPVDMYAFHCAVPAGVEQLIVTFDFVVPTDRLTFHHPSAASPYAAMISWTSLLLYPAETPVETLTYRAVLRLPDGWKYGTTLTTASQSSTEIVFAPVPLYTLIDSPVVAGAHFRTLDLSPGSATPYAMHLAADSEAALQMKPQAVSGFQNLIPETLTLFGARHFGQYRFLATLSDPLSGGAVEHHESSENRPPERMFVDEDEFRYWADTLPHEMVHSWIGKYRRPAGLNFRDYQQPVHGELLWVYEGLTNYYGYVLASRSGLLSPEDFRGAAAWMAADQDHRAGRSWKPLADTAAGVQVVIDASSEWRAWRRSRDYYNEGFLIWLEVDSLMREKSSGRSSLDDFCRSFFGGTDGPPEVKPFTLDEMTAALNAIVPYNWKQHFASRVEEINVRAPLGGLEQSGWRLAYGETAAPYHGSVQKSDKQMDLRFSVGLLLKEDGAVVDVIPASPAAAAGAAPGLKITGVNGRRWSQSRMEEAVAASKGSPNPLELLVEDGDFYKVIRMDYHGGAKYPILERIEGREDVLSRIGAPRSTTAKK